MTHDQLVLKSLLSIALDRLVFRQRTAFLCAMDMTEPLMHPYLEETDEAYSVSRASSISFASWNRSFDGEYVGENHGGSTPARGSNQPLVVVHVQKLRREKGDGFETAPGA